MNQIRLILAFPFAILLRILMTTTIFVIIIGITIRRGSYTHANEVAWEYLDILEKIKF